MFSPHEVVLLETDHMQLWKDKVYPETIFTELSVLVASCIMLDSIRNKIPGDAATLFPNNYMASCDDALYDFCNIHWPCEFTSHRGRCVNTKARHIKGMMFGACVYRGR